MRKIYKNYIKNLELFKDANIRLLNSEQFSARFITSVESVFKLMILKLVLGDYLKETFIRSELKTYSLIEYTKVNKDKENRKLTKKVTENFNTSFANKDWNFGLRIRNINLEAVIFKYGEFKGKKVQSLYSSWLKDKYVKG